MGNAGENVGSAQGWVRRTEGGSHAPENAARRNLWDSFVRGDPLDTETEQIGVPVMTTDDFQIRHVGAVAGVIGFIVLFLGLVGILYNIM